MSKNNKSYSQRLQEVLKGLREAADEFNKHPSFINKSEFKTCAPNVSEWDLRTIGGLDAIKKANFPLTEKELAEIQKQSQTKNYISKLERQVGDKINFEKQFLQVIEKSISSIKVNKFKLPVVKKDKTKKELTMELMISDVHYGKKSETFNIEICRKRMKELCAVFMKELDHKKASGFNIDKIIVALLGDMIESFTMHGLESATGCEFGNARQVEVAIQSLFDDILLPIALLGIPVDVPCVTGNHDRSEKDRTMNNPGENNLTWIIYNVLQKMCKLAKLTNVNFYITKDSFLTLDIYGSVVLYEHGDNLKNTQKGTIENLIRNRSRQCNKIIDMARFGHWHEYVCFDRGRIIINESVCGQDSYAKVKGFSSTAGQTINYYVNTKHRPNSFYYSFPVHLE